MVGFFPDNLIPRNKNGELLWEKDGLLVSSKFGDGIKYESFKCKNFDKKSGLRKDYESRPEICKKTSCVEENLNESIDNQHEKFVNEKFIQIK